MYIVLSHFLLTSDFCAAFQDRISVLLVVDTSCKTSFVAYICICVDEIIVLQALHHPFTAPNPEDMNDLASARALAYDMVYNGVEVIFYPFKFLFIFWHLQARSSYDYFLPDVNQYVVTLFPMVLSDWWGKFENI